MQSNSRLLKAFFQVIYNMFMLDNTFSSRELKKEMGEFEHD